MADSSFRELIRSPEGTIGRSEFRRGAAVVLALSLVLGLLLFGVYRVNHDMDWMTVAIAPFFGVIFFVCGASLIYFWYCLFAKRLRGSGKSQGAVNGWLILLLVAASLRLIAYQNETLIKETEGWLAWTGYLSGIAAIAAALVFAFLLVTSAIRD